MTGKDYNFLNVPWPQKTGKALRSFHTTQPLDLLCCMLAFALGGNPYGLMMGLWQDAQNERNMNRMLLMGERATPQVNELKSSVPRRCSMLLNSKSYTN